MRLIDADALMELVEKTHCTGCNSYNKVRCRACPTGDMLDYLDDAPTVDRWHYPSKGELPPRTGEYLVHFHTMTGYYTDVRELNPQLNNLTYGVGEWVVAWQYIIPPKEEENERG